MKFCRHYFRRIRVPALVLAGLSGLSMLTGCEQTLETGYTPRRFDMTASRERAIYADPYSKEAQEAKQEDNAAPVAHRPGQNY